MIVQIPTKDTEISLVFASAGAFPVNTDGVGAAPVLARLGLAVDVAAAVAKAIAEATPELRMLLFWSSSPHSCCARDCVSEKSNHQYTGIYEAIEPAEPLRETYCCSPQHCIFPLRKQQLSFGI